MGSEAIVKYFFAECRGQREIQGIGKSSCPAAITTIQHKSASMRYSHGRGSSSRGVNFSVKRETRVKSAGKKLQGEKE